MDVKKIESLAKLMQETGLTGLELVEGDVELRLERQQEVVAVAPAAPVMPAILIPTKVAELMAMGPGVIWEIVTRSVNSFIPSHP